MALLSFSHALHALLVFIATLLAIPITVLALECFAALRLKPKPKSIPRQSPEHIVVLVPAHNEAQGIRITLESLLPQLSDPKDIVVIADNCTDDTAAIARSYGVTVLERHDDEHRGKGYALDHGIAFLCHGVDPAEQTTPPTQGCLPDTVFTVPDVVFTVDADCQVHPQTLNAASCLAHQTQQPVQVTNTLKAPAQAQLRDVISSFAFRLRTFVRPNGLSQLKFPSTLHGTGMTFPWPILKQLKLASGSIVEDMQLSLELIMTGYHPLFCPEGEVSGVLPQQSKIATQQRTRWEHGHLDTLIHQVPRLLREAAMQRRLELLAIALDLCIPPLSLLVILWFLPTLLAVALGIFSGTWFTTIMLLTEGLLLLLTILTAWFRFGRDQLPLTTLFAVPFYILWKLPIYVAFLIRPERTWVRTERE